MLRDCRGALNALFNHTGYIMQDTRYRKKNKKGG
jgi:hypothetical protein